MRITYDDTKRVKTLKERGLDFIDATCVFAGLHYVESDDRFEYAEERFVSVGLLDQDVVVLVWTERDDSRRIISMRKADRDERREYHKWLDRSG